jgi:hypothetical protein
MLLILFLFSLNLALDNGLALTPPMGWMAWEQYHCILDCEAYPRNCIGEDLFVDMVDRLAEDGWLELGYNMVNIDDCWMSNARDANDELTANSTRFPHGIKWLSDYAHSKGIKLGIYNDYGTETCGGYPGSEGYLEKDAKTFANWEVDYLKMDGCDSPLLDKGDAYPAMHYFLNATGRPIVYSCSWPAYNQSMSYDPLPPHCNLWRNYNDIRSNWTRILQIINIWGTHPQWADYAGPGHWNDPDQIIIGMTPNSWASLLPQSESRTIMSIWAIVAAPLIMSNDLRNITSYARDILMNKEVIDVDQDPLGKAGIRLSGIDVFTF